jgi:hypothetical protein
VPASGSDKGIFRTAFDIDGRLVAVTTPGSDAAYPVYGDQVVIDSQAWKWVSDKKEFVKVEGGILQRIDPFVIEDGNLYKVTNEGLEPVLLPIKGGDFTGGLVQSKDGWIEVLHQNLKVPILRINAETFEEKEVRFGIMKVDNQWRQWNPELLEWETKESFSVMLDKTHDMYGHAHLIEENTKANYDFFLNAFARVNSIDYLKKLTQGSVETGDELKEYILSTYPDGVLPQLEDGTLPVIYGTDRMSYMVKHMKLEEEVDLRTLLIQYIPEEEYILRYDSKNYDRVSHFLKPLYLASIAGGDMPVLNEAIRVGLVPVDTGSGIVLAVQIVNSTIDDKYRFPGSAEDVSDETREIYKDLPAVVLYALLSFFKSESFSNSDVKVGEIRYNYALSSLIKQMTQKRPSDIPPLMVEIR